MSKLNDLTGQSFGELTVIDRVPPSIAGNLTKWFCQCGCGNITEIFAMQLLNGKAKTCGCDRGNSDGDKGTSLHNIWSTMKDRITNPNNRGFKDYGGRGLPIQWNWLWNPDVRGSGYAQFKLDMGKYPDPHPTEGYYTINRINNDDGYYRDNCEWATMKSQQNNRRDNRHLTYNNKTQTVAQWSVETGISDKLIRQRIDREKWSIERALTTLPKSKV